MFLKYRFELSNFLLVKTTKTVNNVGLGYRCVAINDQQRTLLQKSICFLTFNRLYSAIKPTGPVSLSSQIIAFNENKNMQLLCKIKINNNYETNFCFIVPDKDQQ